MKETPFDNLQVTVDPETQAVTIVAPLHMLSALLTSACVNAGQSLQELQRKPELAEAPAYLAEIQTQNYQENLAWAKAHYEFATKVDKAFQDARHPQTDEPDDAFDNWFETNLPDWLAEAAKTHQINDEKIKACRDFVWSIALIEGDAGQTARELLLKLDKLDQIEVVIDRKTLPDVRWTPTSKLPELVPSATGDWLENKKPLLLLVDDYGDQRPVLGRCLKIGDDVEYQPDQWRGQFNVTHWAEVEMP